jgi:CheY-like chemotaxis protein
MSHDVDRAEHDARRRTASTAKGKGSSSVFVVEDDPDVSNSVVAALRDEGYPVNSAQNGREALDALRAQFHAPPGVILLDLMMPVMDGRQFRLEQLRDPSIAAIPVVLFTADPSGLRDSVAMQVDAMLMKPATLEQILLVVERFCSSARRGT